MLQKLLRVSAYSILLFLVLFRSAWSESAYDRQGDLIPPGAELWSNCVLERIIVGEHGHISSVIINDMMYTVDERTVVRTASGAITSLAKFDLKMLLDFYALDTLLTKVMPALPSQQESGVGLTEETGQAMAPEVQPASSNGQVRQEDGIWKN